MTPPLIFDRQVYLRRFTRASGEAIDLLQARLGEELAERLSVINRQFPATLLISPRPQAFAPVLAASGKCGAITPRVSPAGDDLGLPALAYDAVFSLLDLHAVNDVPGYMAQVAASLVPDGLALFAFAGGDSLRELRDAWLAAETEITGGASPRVAPMIDIRETGGLLQRAGLALPVADIDRVALRYGHALALMRDVKQAGLANCMADRSRRATSRRLLLAVQQHYASAHAHADGRLPATLDLAWAMAWKPHPGQQQPLKPGSAKARLADALKVPERKA